MRCGSDAAQAGPRRCRSLNMVRSRFLNLAGVTPMMRAVFVAGGIVLCLALAGTADAQTLDARRLGMGGVLTSDVGDHQGSNIAFRAVPKGAAGSGSIPLPLGLIQYLSDH